MHSMPCQVLGSDSPRGSQACPPSSGCVHRGCFPSTWVGARKQGSPPESRSAPVSRSESTPRPLFPGCAAQRNFCDGTWCQNGGTCVSGWNTYLCECPLRFGGKNCEQGEGLVPRVLGARGRQPLVALVSPGLGPGGERAGGGTMVGDGRAEAGGPGRVCRAQPLV